MEPIRVVIADDEALARDLLQRLVGDESGFAVVGVAATGKEALQIIRKQEPDLAFLDVSMPGMDGLELARMTNDMKTPPFVVFVTAFDDYAIRAFDLNALDYMVKPVEKSRFERTIGRARTAVRVRRMEALGQKIAAVATDSKVMPGEPDAKRFIVVKQREELIRIAERDIYWLEAASQYVRIHTANCDYMVAEPLVKYHARLSQNMFIRVHRSAVVNVNKVARVLRKQHGVHELRLANGVGVPLSRSRKGMVSEFLLLCAEQGGADG